MNHLCVADFREVGTRAVPGRYYGGTREVSGRYQGGIREVGTRNVLGRYERGTSKCTREVRVPGRYKGGKY